MFASERASERKSFDRSGGGGRPIREWEAAAAEPGGDVELSTVGRAPPSRIAGGHVTVQETGRLATAR